METRVAIPFSLFSQKLISFQKVLNYIIVREKEARAVMFLIGNVYLFITTEICSECGFKEYNIKEMYDNLLLMLRDLL